MRNCDYYEHDIFAQDRKIVGNTDIGISADSAASDTDTSRTSSSSAGWSKMNSHSRFHVLESVDCELPLLSPLELPPFRHIFKFQAHRDIT